MNGRARRYYSSGLLVLLITSCLRLWAGEPEPIINLRSPRGEIRLALLKQTPINSSAADIVKFISKKLHPDANAAVALVRGAAPVSTAKRGAKFIRIYLGQYYDHPEVVFFAAPLMSQREVSAVWIFDEHDRLIDIVVDKQTSVY